jgi:MYXO-CTERM domain-containing protein
VECTTNAQCTGGRTCDPTGKCVGPDAGVPEAGPVDSGPPRDSGPVDAGPPPLDATPPPVDVFAIEGGGCDCSTTTSRDPSGAAGSALLALGVATVLTRRRRRSGAQL